MDELAAKAFIVLLLFALIFGCKTNTKYRPSIYGHDYMEMTIISPTKERVSCGAPEFQDYASFALEDISKIKLALKEGKFSRKVRVFLEGILKDAENIRKENKKRP